MHSPLFVISVSVNKMTRKWKKNRKQVVKSSQATVRAKVPTPFADAAEHVGNLLPWKGVGKWARAVGGAIGTILGSGDYVTNSEPVRYNTLRGDPPQFASSKPGNIVKHREYIGDITTSGTAGAWSSTSFALNPGMSGAFPWLSNIAQCYQQYKMHGCCFEFISMSADALNSTNTALGSVILATEYNANAPAYTSKQTMENAEFSISTKPSKSVIHMIECARDQSVLGELYVRTIDSTSTSSDLRLSDLGFVQVATTGFQGTNVNIGELWVTYEVEFLKPYLPPGGAELPGFHFMSTGVTNSAPFGTTIAATSGNISYALANSTTLNIVGLQIGALYETQLLWGGSSTAIVASPSVSLTGMNFVNLLGPSTADSSSYMNSPYPGSSPASARFMYVGFATATSSIAIITLGTGGTLPTGTPSVDVLFTQLDSTITK